MRCSTGIYSKPFTFSDIYFNDLSNVCKYSTPILYADDTNLFLNGMDLSETENAINADLKQVSLWLKVNKLSSNVEKTHFIVFTNKGMTCHQLKIMMEGEVLQEVFSTKFLGVIIDKKWTTPIRLHWLHYIIPLCFHIFHIVTIYGYKSHLAKLCVLQNKLNDLWIDIALVEFQIFFLISSKRIANSLFCHLFRLCI